MNRIAGVILAAGMSRRLGRPKQLLVLDGSPLIGHVVDRALASTLDEVIVVTGASTEPVQAALDGREVRFVHNPRYNEGQGASLAAGIGSLGADVDGAVILLGDQPGVSTATINRVVKAYREAHAPVVMARYGQKRGHPVLFGREVFPELAVLGGDTGGREVVRAHQDELVLVDGGADVPPSDVDTEEAWANLQRSWSETQ